MFLNGSETARRLSTAIATGPFSQLAHLRKLALMHLPFAVVWSREKDSFPYLEVRCAALCCTGRAMVCLT